MTTIEWCRNDDGSDGLSWNALRAEREIVRKGKTITVSANHCEHVNEACRFCYSERGNFRLGGLPFKPGHRKDYRFVINERKLLEPIRRRKPTRIFVESTSDAFGEWWPREFVDKLYAVMALCPHHLFINLSKRPERRREFLGDPLSRNSVELVAEKIRPGTGPMAPKHTFAWPLPNVVEGVSVSCQPEADEFLPILLNTNAAIRAVSCEPLLGPIDLSSWPDSVWLRTVGNDGAAVRPGLDWVIVGGESGPRARPTCLHWVRSLRDQCAAAGVPFFFKQWGEFEYETRPGTEVVLADLAPNECARWGDGKTNHVVARRVGKKAAGRLLDGREHNAMPALPRIQQDAAA